jgi:hypothetical protein
MAKNDKNSTDQPKVKTRDQVEELKLKWVENPSFELEETEGFEEFADELKQFAQAKQTEWYLQNQRDHLENIKETFELFKKTFEGLNSSEKQSALTTLESVINDEAIDLPEFEEFKTIANAWANEQLTIVTTEINNEKALFYKSEIENIKKLWGGLDIDSKIKNLEKIKNTEYPKNSSPEFEDFLISIMEWANAQLLEINSQLAVEKFNECLIQGMENLKIIDYIACNVMQSLYNTLGYKTPADQIATMSYDIATAMMAEKHKRGL